MVSVPQICTRAKLIASKATGPTISVLADCASSLLKQRLRDLNIAFAYADVDGILAFFTDDIRWQIIGAAEMRGTEAVRAAVESMQGVLVRDLVIHSIIVDGREGAINGEITTANGNIVAFCDVCRFASRSGHKIDMMKSYTLKINQEG